MITVPLAYYIIFKFGKKKIKNSHSNLPSFLHGIDFTQNSGYSVTIPTTHSFAMTRSIICDIGEIYLLLASML